mmetsp:Transcript_56015/g.137363  ORF Transcript_56015/g.137363 Transcript_56015/m.137363 type:complete len:760 (-) Transcript_56015:34-2313(-)
MQRGWAGALLWAAVLLVSSVATRAPKHMPKFVFSRNESPITLPVSVNVVLVGFENDAEPKSFRLSAEEFQYYLSDVMPDHQPSCVETGEKLHVKYEVMYDIQHVGGEHAEKLIKEIHGGMHKSQDIQPMSTITGKVNTDGVFVPVFDVPVTASLEKAFDDTFARGMALSYGSPYYENIDDIQGEMARAYGIIILNLDKSKIAPREALQGPDPHLNYVYRYVMADGRTFSGGDSFVGRGRYAVVDLSAGPSQFGNSQAGEGTVVPSTIPRRYEQSWAVADARGEDLSAKFQASLANVIISSVKFLFAPDMQFDTLDFSEKVLVPLIVFRDHTFYNPLEQGHIFSIDVEQITREVQRMAMPDQKVEVITGLQSLLEHERVAIALTKAMRADTIHESHGGRYQVKATHYLDSQTLFQELRDTGDYLASGLISASPVLSHTYFPDFADHENTVEGKGRRSAKWAFGTRVLPVFIFSIADEVEPMLFDTRNPYAVAKDMVVVVQSGHNAVPLPYFTGIRQLTTSLRDPTASVIAGVGSALGGLMPPYRRYSQSHARTQSNYLWAHGFGVFGPFSNGTVLSQILIDQILTNSVVSRLDASVERVTDALLRMDSFADKYLYDPLGQGISEGRPLGLLEKLKNRGKGAGPLPVSNDVIKELHEEMLTLEMTMTHYVDTLYIHEPAQIHSMSDEIFKSASEFHSKTIQTLQQAEDRLECCSVQHVLIPRRRWSLWARALLIGLIASCAVALIAYLNPKQRSRLKPVVR